MPWPAFWRKGVWVAVLKDEGRGRKGGLRGWVWMSTWLCCEDGSRLEEDVRDCRIGCRRRRSGVSK